MGIQKENMIENAEPNEKFLRRYYDDRCVNVILSLGIDRLLIRAIGSNPRLTDGDLSQANVQRVVNEPGINFNGLLRALHLKVE